MELMESKGSFQALPTNMGGRMAVFCDEKQSTAALITAVKRFIAQVTNFLLIFLSPSF